MKCYVTQVWFDHHFEIIGVQVEYTFMAVTEMHTITIDPRLCSQIRTDALISSLADQFDKQLRAFIGHKLLEYFGGDNVTNEATRTLAMKLRATYGGM